MRYCLTFSLGALALAQLSFATPFDDAHFDFSDAAITSAETLPDTITAYQDLDARTRAYPTSFSPFPTNNADYAAMTQSQHSNWCKTAKPTAPGYSRACIDGVWDSLYRRTDAPENEIEARGTYPTSFSPFPTNNADYAAMTKSQHSKWCKTAKKTAPGYSRACIDGVWDSLYRRTDGAEAEEIDTTATGASSPATAQISEHEITSAPTSDEDLHPLEPEVDGKKYKYIPSSIWIPEGDPWAASAISASMIDLCKNPTRDNRYKCTVWAEQTVGTAIQPLPAKRTAGASDDEADEQQAEEKRGVAAWFHNVRCTNGVCKHNKVTKTAIPLKRAAAETAPGEPTTFATRRRSSVVDDAAAKESASTADVEGEAEHEKRDLAKWFAGIRCTAGQCGRKNVTKSVLDVRAEEEAVAKVARSRIVEEEKIGDKVFGFEEEEEEEGEEQEEMVQSERRVKKRSLAALFSRIGNWFG